MLFFIFEILFKDISTQKHTIELEDPVIMAGNDIVDLGADKA